MKHASRAAQLLTAASLIAALGSAPASAEPLVEAGEGLTTDRPARATRARASAVGDNPALLPLVENAEVAYSVTGSDGWVSGHGLYAALPLFGFLGLGASVEFLGDTLEATPLRRYRVGLGAALRELVAIGLAYTFYGSDTDAEVDDFGAFSFGLSTRLIPGLALGVSVDNAATPRLGERWLEPVWRFAAGTALFDGRLKADIGYASGGPVDDTVEAAIVGTAIDGLDVFASTRADLGADRVRFGGGAELRLGTLAVSASAFAADLPGQGLVFDGVTAGIGISETAARSVFTTGTRWVRMRLPSSAPERAAQAFFSPAGPSLSGILTYFEAIRRDPSVEGLLIEVEGAGYGFAQLYELRAQLQAIRDSGVTVVVHLEDPSTRSWYLGSVADRLYISPSAIFAVRGFATTANYYGGAFMLFGLNPQFVKIDEFKTAPDAWTKAGPTDEGREQLDAYLDAIFEEIVDASAASRGLSAGQVGALFDEAPLRPGEAVDAGLADDVLYVDEVEDAIEAWIGRDVALDRNYSPAPPFESSWTQTPAIAVVHIDGTIARGPSVEVPLLGGFTTGSRTVNAVLDWAEASPDIVGIVIRIDSPGGSAHASDQMHRTIERVGKSKPVVVSMGDIAASGGYYVAAPAAEIFATPVTLTGSIGVFAGKFDFSAALYRVGINQVVYKRGAFADLWSTAVAWDDEARAQAFDQVLYLYEEFIDRVARGRNLEVALARSVADGRVWAGRDAVDRGLVDQIGGILPAIDAVKSRAGVEGEVHTLHVPTRGPLSAFEVGLPIDLIEALGDGAPVEAPGGSGVELVQLLVGSLVGHGSVPLSMALEPGEPLMVVPFDLTFQD